MLEPITTTPRFKPAFQKRYAALTDWDAFAEYSTAFLRRSIRVNTLLTTVAVVKKSIQAKGWQLTPIPWCSGGFWIAHPERRDVGNLLEHHLGYIYVQEAASMIPPLILQPEPNEKVLDLCASPGSKTTQMAAMMQNTGILVANDYKGQRLQSLGINLQRSGVTNCLVTLMPGQRFKEHQFDKILVDAPCSGTGTIRKSLKTITIWNAHMITKLARQQFKILEAAWNNLRPGGILVYSTCSVEPEENEGVVHRLLSAYEVKVLPAKLKGLKTSKPITNFGKETYDPRVKDTLRIWPQDNDTEGFYVAKLQKPL